MKKILIVTIMGFFALSSYAQLNPVRNLSFAHEYDCPENYFWLTWDEPEASTDTLIGYNVYRNQDLFCFLTETRLYDDRGGHSNCSGDFLSYYDDGFFIYVTAVYNSPQQESVYVDSAYCYGMALNMKEVENFSLVAYPNPVKDELTIDNNDVIESIELFDINGKSISALSFVQNRHITIPIQNIPTGVYMLQIKSNKRVINKKIIKN